MIDKWGADHLLLAEQALEHGMTKTRCGLARQHQHYHHHHHHHQQQQQTEKHDGLPPSPRGPAELNSNPQRHRSTTRDVRPARGCLRKREAAAGRTAAARHITFTTSSPRCLVTGLPYECHHPQDGKAWRHEQAVQIREGRMLQALLGAEEYRPHVKKEEDRWADRGWESMGLVEDTPMGGMSLEMDLEAEQWHARQMEFDKRLEENHELAERNRERVQREVRRSFGADAMGTREFVHYRLRRMGRSSEYT